LSSVQLGIRLKSPNWAACQTDNKCPAALRDYGLLVSAGTSFMPNCSARERLSA
jgi:hypothetical protein